MKVLVIGGSQFNGYFLVQELNRLGHEVTVVNRGKTKADLPKEVECLVADRTDAEALSAVIGRREFDCVHDMCAYHPEDTHAIMKILEGNVGHYIFPSSTVIYASTDSTDSLPITEDSPEERGQDQIEYGLHKLLCEDILNEAFKERSFPATTVPFAMVMGPRNIIPDREQRMITRVLLGRPILVPGDGTIQWQAGDVGDQARALCMMMGKSETFGNRYNLTGKDFWTDLEYIEVIERVTGKKADVRHIPADLMNNLWDGNVSLDTGSINKVNIDIRVSETSKATRQENTIVRFRLANLVQRLAPNIHRWDKDVYFGIDRICSTLDFKPEKGIEDMISEVYEWMQAEKVNPEFNWEFEDQILELL